MSAPSRALKDSGSDFAELRKRANRERQEAVALVDEAARVGLSVWLNRLCTIGLGGPRHSILKRVLDVAIALCSADYANIQLLDAGAGGLKLEAHRGFKRPFLEFFKIVPNGHCACGAALNRRSAVIVPDVAASSLFSHGPTLEVLLDAGVRSVKSAALITPSGRLFGVLSVHYREPKPYNHDDVLRFKILANKVATSITAVS